MCSVSRVADRLRALFPGQPSPDAVDPERVRRLEEKVARNRRRIALLNLRLTNHLRRHGEDDVDRGS